MVKLRQTDKQRLKCISPAVLALSHAHARILPIMFSTCPRLNQSLFAACWLSLILVCQQNIAHAGVTDEHEILAGNIVLDNTDASEIVISNTDTEAIPTEELTTANHTKPVRWQSGKLPYQSEVQAAAEVTQLEPALIHAVIATESGYNPRAVSRKGAFGLMQVMPATAKTMTTVPVRQWSVPQQILWGSRYLKRMVDMFEGDVTLALAAYNAGPAAVKAHQHSIPPFTETRQYVPRVLGYYQSFKARSPQVNH
ncbi:lytic transglycosylase domain-containing protein [Methylophilus methylotrophus]|uniref:lytic transglycosylase domain-containing protein n=1 Tax=Methylophilus methylotrophus TaxID=17 RepID=UPI0003817D17|nr:lytic transglycosylase domain-containing protein [Methylophilus methylotrophus]